MSPGSKGVKIGKIRRKALQKNVKNSEVMVDGNEKLLKMAKNISNERRNVVVKKRKKPKLATDGRSLTNA